MSAKQTRARTRRQATAAAAAPGLGPAAPAALVAAPAAAALSALPRGWVAQAWRLARKSEDSAFRDGKYEEGLSRAEREDRGLGAQRARRAKGDGRLRERALGRWALYRGNLEAMREERRRTGREVVGEGWGGSVEEARERAREVLGEEEEEAGAGEEGVEAEEAGGEVGGVVGGEEGREAEGEVEMQEEAQEEVSEEQGGGGVEMGTGERDDPIVVSAEEESAGEGGVGVGGEEREEAAEEEAAEDETAEDEGEWWLDVEGQDAIFVGGEIDLVKAHQYIEEGVGDYADISDGEMEEIGAGLGGHGAEAEQTKRNKRRAQEGSDDEMRQKIVDAGLAA